MAGLIDYRASLCSRRFAHWLEQLAVYRSLRPRLCGNTSRSTIHLASQQNGSHWFDDRPALNSRGRCPFGINWTMGLGASRPICAWGRLSMPRQMRGRAFAVLLALLTSLGIWSGTKPVERVCNICRFVDGRGDVSFTECRVPASTTWPGCDSCGSCCYQCMGPAPMTDKYNRSDPRKQREMALKVARKMFADMAA
jgi:hypothetical protein